MSEILRIEDLTKKFKKKNLFSADSNEITAADKVNFSLNHGEILAIAGQSGSGKSYNCKINFKSNRTRFRKNFLQE